MTAMESNIKDIQEQLGGALNNLKKGFDGITREMDLVQNPAKEKGFRFNGKNAVISLLKDGRIMIKLSSMEDSELFYSESPALTYKDLTRLQNEWKSKNIFKRIFTWK